MELRSFLETGLRLVYDEPAKLAEFVAKHDAAPSLILLFQQVKAAFCSSGEAIAWLYRRVPAFDGAPYDLIAEGDAKRVVRALAALTTEAT